MSEIDTHNLVVDFGKHKGQRWTRLPVSYLKWLINEGTQYADISKAELERRGTTLDYSLEISGHALDRASLQCRKIWHENRSEDEGLHSWLMRVSEEALKCQECKVNENGDKVIFHLGMKLVFSIGEIYPTLKTVMRRDK